MSSMEIVKSQYLRALPVERDLRAVHASPLVSCTRLESQTAALRWS